MPTKKTKRAPAKVSAPKLPAKEPVAPEPVKETQLPIEVEAPVLAQVDPLDRQVFQLLMSIIDNTDFKGREINQVIGVKMELARVAGLRQGDGK